MVRKKYSTEEEINWNITEINLVILSLIFLFFFPFFITTFFLDFLLEKAYTFTYTSFSLTFQIQVALRLANRYSISEKNEKLRFLDLSQLTSFVIYFSVFWFASYLIQIILITSRTLDFLSEAAIQSFDYYQYYPKNFDIESFKIVTEQVSILTVCNFLFLLFGIFKLNKKKEKLINKRKYRKVIKE